MAAPTWTQADIDKLKAAISSGALTVSYDGPPRQMITYQSLEAMRSLLAEMLGQVNGRTAYRRVSHSKGF